MGSNITHEHNAAGEKANYKQLGHINLKAGLVRQEPDLVQKWPD